MTNREMGTLISLFFYFHISFQYSESYIDLHNLNHIE